MFRFLSRRPRTIRVPVNEASGQIQEVKVAKRSVLQPRNLIPPLFIAYFVYEISEVKLSPEDEKRRKRAVEDFEGWRKDRKKELSEERARRGEQFWDTRLGRLGPKDSNASIEKDRNSEFPNPVSAITLPVWFRARRPPMYQPSDPEFKEYAKLQSDKKRMDDLKRTVGKWAGARLENPVHQVNLGMIGFTGNIGLTFDIVPQLIPPNLYEVPCVLFTNGKLYFTWRTLPPQKGTRMDAIFRPGVTFEATKRAFSTFASAVYTITRAKVRNFYQDTLKSSPFEIGSQSMARAPPVPARAVLTEKDIARDNAIPEKGALSAQKKGVDELLRAIHSGKVTREQHHEIIKAVPYSTAIHVAAGTFKRAQILGHAAEKQLNTRGTVQIRGLVSCFGKRGVYKMEVIAFYHPAEDAFLGPIVVRNAYVVMNYGSWQQWHEKGLKAILSSQSNGIDHEPPSSSTSDDEKS